MSEAPDPKLRPEDGMSEAEKALMKREDEPWQDEAALYIRDFRLFCDIARGPARLEFLTEAGLISLFHGLRIEMRNGYKPVTRTVGPFRKPPADTPSPEGRAGPSIPAPESPGPSSRGNDPGAGLRADGKGGTPEPKGGEGGVLSGLVPGAQTSSLPPPPQSSAGQPPRDAPRGASPSPGRCPVHNKPFRVPLKGNPYCPTPIKKVGDRVLEWCSEKPQKAGWR